MAVSRQRETGRRSEGERWLAREAFKPPVVGERLLRGAACLRSSATLGRGVRDAAEAKSRAELAPKGREAAWREVLADS